MIDKADIVRILKNMRDECMKSECYECEVSGACNFRDNRIPAEWTDEELLEVMND